MHTLKYQIHRSHLSQFDLNALTEQREDPSVMLQFTPILHKQPIQILTKRMRENNRITEEQETKII